MVFHTNIAVRTIMMTLVATGNRIGPEAVPEFAHELLAIHQDQHEDQHERQQNSVGHLRNRINFNSGNPGIRTKPAPMTISAV